jgi:hypothetical protein
VFQLFFVLNACIRLFSLYKRGREDDDMQDLAKKVLCNYEEVKETVRFLHKTMNGWEMMHFQDTIKKEIMAILLKQSLLNGEPLSAYLTDLSSKDRLSFMKWLVDSRFLGKLEGVPVSFFLLMEEDMAAFDSSPVLVDFRKSLSYFLRNQLRNRLGLE